MRTVQPVLQDLEAELEEAAASLGASRWQTLRRVILPTMLPAVLTGFALAFGRALGEYGSVIFISGNMPMKTEIAPLLIITKLEQYDYAGATGIALVMLARLVRPAARRSTRSSGGAGGTRRHERREPRWRSSGSRGARPSRATSEPRVIRWTLISVALAFLVLFLCLPLVAVFVHALEKGVGAYFGALVEPDAWAAIRLTLLTAAIAVPLNLVFGLAAAWAIAKFDFPGKSAARSR